MQFRANDRHVFREFEDERSTSLVRPSVSTRPRPAADIARLGTSRCSNCASSSHAWSQEDQHRAACFDDAGREGAFRTGSEKCHNSNSLKQGLGGGPKTISFGSKFIALLPGLSAFARCLTGNAEQPDELVRETCARALANMDQWQHGTHLSSWVFHIAQNLWFDRQRAEKFWREPRGSEVWRPSGGQRWACGHRKSARTREFAQGARPALAAASRVDSFGERLRPQLHSGRRNPEPTPRDGDTQTGPGSPCAPRCSRQQCLGRRVDA